MAKQLMPRAELESRDSDVRLTDDEFLQLSLFAQLKRKPSLDKFPGAMVLRHYRKGELIFRQGEGGWTAFYILTSEDALQLLEAAPKADLSSRRRQELEGEAAALRAAVGESAPPRDAEAPARDHPVLNDKVRG